MISVIAKNGNINIGKIKQSGEFPDIQILIEKIVNTNKVHTQTILLFLFPYMHINIPIKNAIITAVIPIGLLNINTSSIDIKISMKLYFILTPPMFWHKIILWFYSVLLVNHIRLPKLHHFLRLNE